MIGGADTLLGWVDEIGWGSLFVGNWGPALWFIAAAAILGAFDISLPRGDSLGVAGALDVITLIVLGPAQAVAVTVLGAFLSHAMRLKMTRRTYLGTSITARLLALAVAAALTVGGVSQPVPSAGVVWLILALVIACFLVVELVVFQCLSAYRAGRSPIRAIRGNIRRQAPLILAQFSTAMLAAVVFPTVGAWSLPLVVALLLLIRQSYSLLLEIRETFRTTVEVLVDAAEGCGGAALNGHAERTALIARELAASCSLSPAEVERVSYAALLHDIGEIAQHGRAPGNHGSSARVIEGVEFFGDVLEIVRLCDGDLSAVHHLSESELLAAFIVALASDVDSAMNVLVAAPWPHAAVERVAPAVPATLKARAVAAAIRSGYRVPAVA